MKIFIASVAALLLSAPFSSRAQSPSHPSMPPAAESESQNHTAVSAEEAMTRTLEFGQQISSSAIRRAAVIQNGRIKALGTMARELALFMTGSYRKWGMDATQIYLTMSSCEFAPYAPLIEIRDLELRKRLGYPSDRRFFSLADLEGSSLESLAEPSVRKQQDGGKLDESERKVVEAYSQMSLFRQLASGEHFVSSIDFSMITGSHGQTAEANTIGTVAREYLVFLRQGKFTEAAVVADQLVSASRTQPAPELFTHYLDTLDLEILFYDVRPFLWGALFSILAGLALIIDVTRKKLGGKMPLALTALCLTPLVGGLVVRVYVTRFAPVTSMYGTMLWVAFGVTIFSAILFILYRNAIVSGFMLVGAGLILMLTENIPLILSPDLDPVVAVLRSNFWLSTHVTTITISYAAFTVAMILGNVTLVQFWRKGNATPWYHDFFLYAYRMVQLGCFLLTVGIILGGIWADYSWGRFWGWDPKETWALIADLGFLVLLHARHIGWLKEFTFLALLPLSYLLVVMAWYGVNFILAAGLHSYGFSSGGATAVVVFVTLQLAMLGGALLKFKLSPSLGK